jgi:uncharacterized protein (DUF58 family)
MFDFDKLDKDDLREGHTIPNAEGDKSLLDHRWVWMGIFIFVLGIVLRNAALVALTGFMLAAVAFCWLWSRYVLRGLSYRRRFHHKRAFPGEDVEASINIENKKWLPMTWVQVEDEWPTAFAPADESMLTASSVPQLSYLVNVYSLRWFERVRRKYLLTARQRGIYPIGPAHVVSGDPFSLFERGSQFAKPDILIVYPVIKPIEAFGLDAKDPFGDLRSPQRLFEDPARTIGIRDYRRGDTYRSIHWKATARTGDLQVRQYEPTRSMSMVLCLNIASFEQHWRGIWPALVEHLLSLAGSITSWGLDAGYAVGITANATLAHFDRSLLAQPNRGRDQLMHLLEILAGVSYFITQEFSQYILAESVRLPWGATLLVITGFLNDEILGALLQLRANGRRVVLIAVGKEAPPALENIISYHIPVPDHEPDQPKVASLGSGKPDEPETPRQRFLREREARQKEKIVGAGM